MSKKIPIPSYDGEFVQIYKPSGDIYRGSSTELFTTNTYYDEWITNDFSILHDNGVWHIVGITHPKPFDFIDSFDFGTHVHEAEYQLFHCTAKCNSFADVFFDGAFTDREKILYPSERKGERPEIWAPHLTKVQDEFTVLYSPKEMRRTVSRDFSTWQSRPPLFVCKNFAARDPYLFEDDGRFYLIYTDEQTVKYCVAENSLDAEFSEERILQERLFPDCENESPFLMKRDGVYYLFWSIYDGKNGCYDNRTLVFAAETLDGLRHCAPLTMLAAHAPEVVCDQSGNSWLLSAFYPHNGISAVKLKWN